MSGGANVENLIENHNPGIESGWTPLSGQSKNKKQKWKLEAHTSIRTLRYQCLFCLSLLCCLFLGLAFLGSNVCYLMVVLGILHFASELHQSWLALPHSAFWSTCESSTPRPGWLTLSTSSPPLRAKVTFQKWGWAEMHFIVFCGARRRNGQIQQRAGFRRSHLAANVEVDPIPEGSS